MPRKVPSFWLKELPVWLRWILLPLTWVYRFGFWARWKCTKSWAPPIPVVCVGNVMAGGVGKTPVVQSLAIELQKHGIKVHCVSRGYGGRLRGPVQVNTNEHDARDVGDEPLLLARHVPTWVSKNRRQGILAACDAGAQVVITDDGLQNPTVNYTCRLLVIDLGIGWGNGQLIPAGPLREPIESALKRIDAVVAIGGEIQASVPVFCAVPENDISMLAKTEPVVAFAGIGHPFKFFKGLQAQGLRVVASKAFPDHYFFEEGDLKELRALQDQCHAKLVTTEKDFVRLMRAERFDIVPIPLRLQWHQPIVNFVIEKIHGPNRVA